MIPFNKPHMTGRELYYIAQAHFNQMLAGDGPFTKRCHAWLEAKTGCRRALLTNSCTAALELSALLLDIQPGDDGCVAGFRAGRCARVGGDRHGVVARSRPHIAAARG